MKPNVRMTVGIFTLVVINLLFIALSQKCHATTYYVTTEQNTLGKVIIDYEPTQSETDRLESLTDRFYQSNKSIKDEYYIERSKRFICNKLSYDYDYRITGERAFSPFPVLDSRKTICMGYTALMQMLLDKKGIINVMVYDTRIEHIWNRMLIHGEWIDIDVTNYDNGG